MQSFKTENYLRDNPGAAPPQFEHVPDDEASVLIENLLSVAGGPKGSRDELIRWFSQQSTPLANVNLDENEIGLVQLFNEAGVSPGPTLYVQWGALEDIDRFKTDELTRHFYDLWYPGADDIEIFDDSAEWLIFVRHYGVVTVWRAVKTANSPTI